MLENGSKKEARVPFMALSGLECQPHSLPLSHIIQSHTLQHCISGLEQFNDKIFAEQKKRR